MVTRTLQSHCVSLNLSMFSGVSLAKAYSPLTARELSSGEHAQRQAEEAEAKAAHAERKAEEEAKAEEEPQAKEDAEAEDEGSTPSATVDGKVVVCAVPSIDMTCAQCVENIRLLHPRAILHPRCVFHRF